MFVSWPFITRLLCNFIYQIFVKTFESPSVASDCRVFCNLHLTTNSQRYLNETTLCYWDKRTSLKMNSREQGYEDDRFENVVSQNFHCPICLNVFKDPVMCQRNQHYFQGWIQTVLWWVPSAEGTRFLGGFGGMRPKKILNFRLWNAISWVLRATLRVLWLCQRPYKKLTKQHISGF